MLTAFCTCGAQEPGTLRWKLALEGGVRSSPALSPLGQLWFGDDNQNFHVVAADSGASIGVKWLHHLVRSSPAVDERGNAYVGSSDGALYGFNQSLGVELRYQTPDSIVSSPAFGADGTIYFGCADRRVYAINPQTAEIRWSFLTKTVVDESPSVGLDGTVYIANDTLYALNGQTGTPLWSRPFGSAARGAPAIGDNGTVYLGTMSGKLYAMDPRNGLSRWEADTTNWISSDVALGVDGTVYVGNVAGWFFALEGQTGIQKWAFQASSPINQSGAAVGVDGTVYFGTSKGRLYAVDGGTGQELWHYDAEGAISTSPTLAPDGTVYFGSTDAHQMYAVWTASRGLAASAWPMKGQNAQHTGNQFRLALPPRLTEEPASTNLALGQSLRLEVRAYGSPPLQFHWEREGLPLPLATRPVLEIAAIRRADLGRYTVVVSNAFGSVRSRDIVVSTNSPAPGVELWEFKTGSSVVSSPAIGPDGTVYVASEDQNLYALEPDTGERKWALPLGGPPGLTLAIGPDGTVFVSCGKSGLCAVRGRTGEKLWEFTAGNFIWGAPALSPDGVVYFGAMDQKVYAVDAVTGTKRWEFAAGADFVSTPSVGDDGTVFIGCLDKKFYALNGTTGVKKWEFVTSTEFGNGTVPALGDERSVVFWDAGQNFYALDAVTGEQRWRVSDGDSGRGSPAIGPGGIVLAPTIRALAAYELQSGAKKWTGSIGNGFFDRIRSSPAIGDDGLVYVGSAKQVSNDLSVPTAGRITAFEIATGTVRWVFATEREVATSPMIGPDGTLYFGSLDQRVYAVATSSRGPARAAWPMLGHGPRRTGSRVDVTPYLLKAPASQVVGLGDQLELSVDVAGSPPLQFQWDRDEVALPGQTNRSLRISPVKTKDAGRYTVWITNAFGFIRSEAANVKVETQLPKILAQPSGHTNATSSTFTLRVLAVNSLPLTYQWFRDEHPLDSRFGAALSISNAQPDDSGRYYVVVSNFLGSVRSDTATLLITPPLIGGKRWDFVTGGTVHGSPALGRDGTVYAGSNDRRVYALSPRNGAVRWSALTGGSVTGSIAVGDDGTVYAGSDDGGLYALEASNGARKWVFKTPRPVASSPAVGPDGTVYFGCEDGKLYALDGATGLKRWEHATGTPVLSSPAISAAGLIYVGSGDIYAIDARTGTRKWTFITPAGVNSSPAIGPDGTVYVGCSDFKLYALDGRTGGKRWEYRTGAPIETSPTIGPDGRVYIASMTPTLYALDATSGLRLWQSAGAFVVDSPLTIAADGRGYHGTGTGRLRAIDTRTGSLLWSYVSSGSIESGPTLAADGSLYFGMGSRVVAVATGSPGLARASWPSFRSDSQNRARAALDLSVSLLPPQANDEIGLSYRLPAGVELNLEFSDDLLHWQKLRTVAGDDSGIRLPLPLDPTAPTRFWRLRQL